MSDFTSLQFTSFNRTSSAARWRGVLNELSISHCLQLYIVLPSIQFLFPSKSSVCHFSRSVVPDLFHCALVCQAILGYITSPVLTTYPNHLNCANPMIYLRRTASSNNNNNNNIISYLLIKIKTTSFGPNSINQSHMRTHIWASHWRMYVSNTKLISVYALRSQLTLWRLTIYICVF